MTVYRTAKTLAPQAVHDSLPASIRSANYRLRAMWAADSMDSQPLTFLGYVLHAKSLGDSLPEEWPVAREALKTLPPCDPKDIERLALGPVRYDGNTYPNLKAARRAFENTAYVKFAHAAKASEEPLTARRQEKPMAMIRCKDCTDSFIPGTETEGEAVTAILLPKGWAAISTDRGRLVFRCPKCAEDHHQAMLGSFLR